MYLFEQWPAKLCCGSLAGQGVFPGEGCIGSDHQSSANILKRSKRSKPVKRCFPPLGFVPKSSQEANQRDCILCAAAAPAGGAEKHLMSTTRCSSCAELFHLKPGAQHREANSGSAEGAECPLPHPQNCWHTVAECYTGFQALSALWLLQQLTQPSKNTYGLKRSFPHWGCWSRLPAPQRCMTKSAQKGRWQWKHALTSCFIRHFPSSVSSALAGGVTSVAIASSSAQERKAALWMGLPEDWGRHCKIWAGNPGTAHSQPAGTACQGISPSRQHPLSVGQELAPN